MDSKHFDSSAVISSLIQKIHALEVGKSADGQIAVVRELLTAASKLRASDIHLQPMHESGSIAFRIDGVVQSAGSLSRGLFDKVVGRLKVLADLLTYQQDRPQEGRLKHDTGTPARVSTFPTVHGERLVIRFFDAQIKRTEIEQLQLGDRLTANWLNDLSSKSGLLLVTGPAGAGKTTTLYASLQHLLQRSANHLASANDTSGLESPQSRPESSLAIMTVEDPVEQVIAGISQSEVHPPTGFDFATAVRSILRQDPDVLMIGEIRDAETLRATYYATLTGHLVLSSFHAGSCLEAVRRLIDMGTEPYMIQGATRAILCQRLVRKLCDCKRPSTNPLDFFGFEIAQCQVPVGCGRCQGLGYLGRVPIAEYLRPADLSTSQLLQGSSTTKDRVTVMARPKFRHLNLLRKKGLVDYWLIMSRLSRLVGS